MSFDYKDNGQMPRIDSLEEMTLDNSNFRTTIWSGVNLQVTLMTIPAGEEMGLETHAGIDQLYHIVEGKGTIHLGRMEDNLDEQQVEAGSSILVPASMWHNLVNDGQEDIKMYTVYGAIEHKPGTVHKTKQDELDDPNE